MVTRSQIDAANPEAVLALIQSWRDTATELESHADSYVRAVERPGGRLWSGLTAEAAVTLSQADRRTIVQSSDAIEEMSSKAYRSMTESVMPKLTNVRAMIENAERLGFTVNDDLSVAWKQRAGMSEATAEQYRQAGVRFSRQINGAAQEWWEAEQQASAQMDRDRSRLAIPFGDSTGGRRRVQLVDLHVPLHPGGIFPQDPTPQMSREQAKAGLRDVDARIWEHNRIEKPVIESLPLNDPRRADFHFDTERLNAEKRQYLDVLFHQHPPESIIGPHGENLPGVAPGTKASGPADSGKGWLFPLQLGHAEINPRVTFIRVMEPTPYYPNGYLVYMNSMGQTVSPSTGRTIPPSDDYAHIPLPN